MRKYLHSSVACSLALVAVLVLAQAESALAQQRLNSGLARAVASVESGNPVETASLESLPSAPQNLPVPTMKAVIQPMFRANAAAMPAAVAPVMVQPYEPGTHRFWDGENSVLFAAAGALAGADFYVTRSNLAQGGKELNPLTRVFAGSTPMLATNFALETAGVMGISYFFHKTGHHKLERMTSFVNIGTSAAAVSYSATHR